MTILNDLHKSHFTRDESIYAQRVIIQLLVTHTIAPAGHTGSFTRSSAHNKSSQQSPEWFDSIGMAKKTPKFGDLPFVQLTTTCTTVNIIESAVEQSFLPLSLLCWAVPVLSHWRCELAKPRFFGVRLGVRTSRTPFQIPHHQNQGIIFFIIT